MGKRKRGSASQQAIADGLGMQNTLGKAVDPPAAVQEKRRKVQDFQTDTSLEPVTIQIVVGTYEKVLHGFTATIKPPFAVEDGKPTKVEFADTFVFNAHGSAIRCLALSPKATTSAKVTLASGGSDQIVNLYSISTVLPGNSESDGPLLPTLAGNKITENPQNKEIGSLQHHAGTINALYFPTRSKLLSAAEDNTIAVARTRDWIVLSTIKAPLPKVQGRPSGDTAPLGGAPTGVNDIAIHPSMKLMLSVSKGERCMRLWNLVTAKKAAVLNFDRELLQAVGEGKYHSGEGRKIEWNSLGEEFAIAFERGCVLYGIDSNPRCLVLPTPRTKIHQMHYVTLSTEEEVPSEVFAVSTEDGRIYFYSTKHVTKPDTACSIPICEPLGVLCNPTDDPTGRVKDFEVLSVPQMGYIIIVSGSTDGAIRFWAVNTAELADRISSLRKDVGLTNGHGPTEESATRDFNSMQVGHLLSTYEAGSRITCLKGFVMSARANNENIDNGNTISRTNCADEDVDDGEDS